jgi:hypothetical protein
MAPSFSLFSKNLASRQGERIFFIKNIAMAPFCIQKLFSGLATGGQTSSDKLGLAGSLALRPPCYYHLSY